MKLTDSSEFKELNINILDDISALVKYQDGICMVNIKGIHYTITEKQYEDLNKAMR